MIDVVSIKFKNRGKSYFFSPNGLQIKSGDKVIVETAKGLEIADCSHGNHSVEDTAVVLPLRPVVRIATADDLRVAELNKKREKEAFKICQQKIEEHGLDMKLVDVECNFEGNKTMFFFTSDGRVDFRELVKDLAGIFRNRIELRQIGVRDEAKMIGGIGICGRPYCCNQFLDEFQPVSTKMAKIQSLSLNPTKISGSCGRLMCCLHYEQEAYEELIKKVPKQGAFVETKDGYGTAVQVNLLRQTVKVRLDESTDDSLHLFKANELAAVPGGRPKDGEAPAHVLHYVPPAQEEEEETREDEWAVPVMVVPEPVKGTEGGPGDEGKKHGSRRRRGGRNKNRAAEGEKAAPPKETPKEAPREQAKSGHSRKAVAQGEKKGEHPARSGEGKNRRNRNEGGKTTVKPVKVEPHAEGEGAAPAAAEGGQPNGSRRRRSRYRGRPRSKSGGENKES